MNEIDIRFECLRLAIQCSGQDVSLAKVATIPDIAEDIYKFVTKKHEEDDPA